MSKVSGDSEAVARGDSAEVLTSEVVGEAEEALTKVAGQIKTHTTTIITTKEEDMAPMTITTKEAEVVEVVMVVMTSITISTMVGKEAGAVARDTAREEDMVEEVVVAIVVMIIAAGGRRSPALVTTAKVLKEVSRADTNLKQPEGADRVFIPTNVNPHICQVGLAKRGTV